MAAAAAGFYHTVFLKTDGTLWAVGYNGDGQLGDGTTTARGTPAQVRDRGGRAVAGVVAAAAGDYHTVFVKADGTLWAMGRNGYGQLGDGRVLFRSTPVHAHLSRVAVAAAGDHHTVFVKTDGTMWTVGYNGNGQLGDGTTTQRTTPVQVRGAGGIAVTGVTAAAAGFFHTVFVKTDGALWAMGYNGSGQLGDGTTTQRSTPVQVKDAGGIAVTGVTAAAAGFYHTVFVKTDGTLWSMGNNGQGQLGDGSSASRLNPVQVRNAGGAPVTGVTAAAVGSNYTVFVKTGGSLWAMGDNGYGQLGDGTTTQRSTPVQVRDVGGIAVTGVAATAAGDYHAAFVKTDGTLWGMGYNVFGQLGDGTTIQRSTAVQVRDAGGITITGVATAAAGKSHTVFVKTEGSLWAMGDNGYGQLGDGTTTQRSTPVQVRDVGGVAVTGVAEAAAGASHTVFVTSAPIQPLQFTLHPVSRIVSVGTSAVFTGAASGTPTPSFQWFISTNGGGAWAPLTNTVPYSGVTTNTLTVANTTTAMTGHQFRCVASTGVGSAATSNAASLTVTKLSQTISFAALPDRSFGNPPFGIFAAASSGLPVSFAVLAGPASIDTSNLVTLAGPGSVTIHATQPGNATYDAAPPADRSFTVANVAPVIAAINPATAIANSQQGFVLTVTGSPFATDATVNWNNQPRATAYINSTELRATIPASDLMTTQDLLLVPIAVSNGSGFVSAPKVFTVKQAGMGNLEAQFVPAGESAVVSTAPTTLGQAGQAELTAVAQNPSGDPLLIAVGTYTQEPPSGIFFDAGNIYYDIKVVGADASDSLAVNFYYPSGIILGNEERLKLRYFNGGPNWPLVWSSGNVPPLKNTDDNLDGTFSGGRFTALFDNTSTPKLTELSGTVFVLADTTPRVAITASAAPVPVGSNVSVGINYKAVGAPETHQIAVAWGDGSSTPAAPAASGNTTASHIYAAPGVYTVRVTVTDESGGAGSGEFNYIVVYDPTAGFVTGAGWITSPAGAYKAAPALAGKAHFGFVSRYQNGANTPTGQTQFTYQMGSVNFHSTEYEWLVVSGARAQFKGSGKINGSGNYGFLLTALDGAGPGGGGTDKFRIKIWDKTVTFGDNIVYDNVGGNDDDINSSGLQALGGGSITIQRR